MTLSVLTHREKRLRIQLKWYEALHRGLGMLPREASPEGAKAFVEDVTPLRHTLLDARSDAVLLIGGLRLCLFVTQNSISKASRTCSGSWSGTAP